MGFVNDPIHGAEHQRIRKALIASGTWLGQPCFWCKKPMMAGEKLALGHASDAEGRSIPGKYVGLTHYKCDVGAGGQVNPWGVRTRAAIARANRTPERQKLLDERAARVERKKLRKEFDAAQQEIREDEQPGREFLQHL